MEKILYVKVIRRKTIENQSLKTGFLV